MARSFNGSGDQIALAAGFAPAAINFSIACWVNPSTNNGSAGHKGRTILCSNNAGSGFNFQLSTGTGTPSVLELDLTNANVLGTSTATVADGSWAHVGATWVNGTKTVSFYINGVFDSSAVGPVALNNAAGYVIGANPGSGGQFFYFGGSMADLLFCTSILTASQFSGLFRGTRPAALGFPLTLNMPLDGLQSPEPDLSGNAFNGTLTGTAKAFGPPFAPFTPRWPLFIPPPVVSTGGVYFAAHP
jgi:Concanavalin A-like lectin/glucanases superfamily